MIDNLHSLLVHIVFTFYKAVILAWVWGRCIGIAVDSLTVEDDDN